ncbi:hypothetical protein EMIT0194MI4_90072 [Pseudomonas sp. IT-194MI4]
MGRMRPITRCDNGLQAVGYALFRAFNRRVIFLEVPTRGPRLYNARQFSVPRTGNPYETSKWSRCRSAPLDPHYPQLHQTRRGICTGRVR